MKRGQDRIFLALVVLALIGLVGFVVMIDDEPQNLVTEEPVGELADEGQLAGDYLRDPFAANDHSDDEDEAQSTGRDPRGDGLHGSRGATLTIMSRATGHAVPGAVALFMAEFDAPPVDWKWRRQEVLMRSGRRLRADSSGLIHVEPFQGAAFMICQFEGQYGERLYSSYHDLFTGDGRLYVDRDGSVPVQVVDEDGRGVAGVPVALWRDNSEKARKSEGREADRLLIWTGVTRGPEGMAFARQSLGLDAKGLPRDPETRAVPIVAELQRGRVYASFYFPPVIPDARRRDAQGPGGIEEASGLVRRLLDETADVIASADGPGVRALVLPGTGSVKLRLFQDDAQVYEGPCAVWIGPWAGHQDPALAKRGEAQDLDPDPGSISDGSLPFLVEKGQVVLPRVGLNTVFDVTIMPLEGHRDPVQIAVVGPTRAREIKVIDVPMGPERAVLVFRVEDEQGQALVTTPIDVELGVPGATRISPEAVKRLRVETDAEGKARIRVPVEFSRYPQMELRLTGPKNRPAEPAPYVAVMLKAPQPEGFVDAGSLRLAGRGLVCRGRVVDAAGRGIDAVDIEIVRKPFTDEVEREASDERLAAWTMPTSITRTMARIRTSSQGYFTHGGYSPAGQWELRLRKTIDGVVFGADLSFEPGASDLELRLQPLPIER